MDVPGGSTQSIIHFFFNFVKIIVDKIVNQVYNMFYMNKELTVNQKTFLENLIECNGMQSKPLKLQVMRRDRTHLQSKA